jgi:hypothetical protein
MSHSFARGDGSRMPERKAAIITVVWLLSVVVILSLFLFGPLALGAYDRSHPKTLTCEVSSAEATSVSVSSTSLSSTTIPQVDVTTTNCGVLTIRHGVTDDNRDRVAASLKPGDWEFVVGAGSFDLRQLLGLLRVRPEIMSYRMRG